MASQEHLLGWEKAVRSFDSTELRGLFDSEAAVLRTGQLRIEE